MQSRSFRASRLDRGATRRCAAGNHEPAALHFSEVHRERQSRHRLARSRAGQRSSKRSWSARRGGRRFATSCPRMLQAGRVLQPVAKALRTSARTLRRRLQMQNTSFRQLSDELRTDVALRYLRGTEMTNDDIAFALGFSDAANFRHAFRRWTGGAPNDYRTPAVWSLRTDFSTPLAPTRWPGRVKAAAHQGAAHQGL